MKAGDRVVALYMPHLGIGLVEWAIAGRLKVSFEVDGKPYTDEFSPFELEMAARAKAAA